jgi:hypothetical protein
MKRSALLFWAPVPARERFPWGVNWRATSPTVKIIPLRLAERAIMLAPSAKDHTYGPNGEENLALIQMMVGENSSAISHLTHLLQTPYSSWLYGPPAITPALLRLDPVWDPLRTDPAFQKLCEEKQP